MAKTVFKGRVFNVESKPFKIGKTTYGFEYLSSGGVVIVLPVLPNGKIIIERQYRHALGKKVYELPAGRMEKGEKPSHAGLRELEEETGYKAGKITYFFKAYASPGLSNELAYFFIATGLKKTKTNREPTEEIELKFHTLTELMKMITNGTIMDAKTIAALFFYRNRTKNG